MNLGLSIKSRPVFIVLVLKHLVLEVRRNFGESLGGCAEQVIDCQGRMKTALTQAISNDQSRITDKAIPLWLHRPAVDPSVNKATRNSLLSPSIPNFSANSSYPALPNPSISIPAMLRNYVSSVDEQGSQSHGDEVEKHTIECREL